MKNYRTYNSDPRWITTKYNAVIDGVTCRKGTRAFYYPLTHTLLVGEKAEQAARDFAAAAFDKC